MLLKAIGIALSGRYASQAVQLAANVALARILTPADIGLSAIALGLITIAHAFRDFGISQYLINKADLTQRDVSACQALALASGAIIAASLALLAGPIESFYGHPGLAGLVRLLAVNFALVPASSVVTAILVRELNQKPLALMEIVQAFTYGIVSVSAALAGAAYHSMALGNTAANAMILVFCIAVRSRTYRYAPGLAGVTTILGRGGSILVTNLANSGAERAPELALGRTQTLESVGLFDRALGTVGLFGRLLLDGVSRVAIPFLSSDAGNRPEEIGRRLAIINRPLCALGFAFFAAIAPITGEVLMVIFGPQWTRSAGLATLLCAAGAIALPAAFARTVFLGIQDYKVMATYVLTSRLVHVALIVTGAIAGLWATAWAVVASALFSTALFAFMGRSFVPRSLWRDAFSLLFGVAVPVGLAALAVATASRHAGVPPLAIVLVTMAATGLVFGVLAWRAGGWGVLAIDAARTTPKPAG